MAENALDSSWQLIKQGAEARIYLGEFLGKKCIVKERFSKKYRHVVLDEKLNKERTRAEVRSNIKCKNIGITTPALYFIDTEANRIYMEYVEDSVLLKDYINENREGVENIAELLGKTLGCMHRGNVIHGDLTTSNVLLKADKLILIDFGLSSCGDCNAEEKAVDLYVLERAFTSAHPGRELVFEQILESYRREYGKEGEAVIKRLGEVRARGRKRSMVG